MLFSNFGPQRPLLRPLLRPATFFSARLVLQSSSTTERVSSIYLCISCFIYLSTALSTCLSIYRFPVYLSVCLCPDFGIRPSLRVDLSVGLPVGTFFPFFNGGFSSFQTLPHCRSCEDVLDLQVSLRPIALRKETSAPAAERFLRRGPFYL